MNKVKRYIEACHTCLKTKPKYMKNRPIYGRIPVDYAPMQDLSIDIKMMPQAFGGYQLLLVITCDQTNFNIAVPLRDRTPSHHQRKKIQSRKESTKEKTYFKWQNSSSQTINFTRSATR